MKTSMGRMTLMFDVYDKDGRKDKNVLCVTMDTDTTTKLL
jgi:hypothetical protein